MDRLARALLDSLAGQPGQPALAVAYSGGRDSTVLLHVAAGLRDAGRLGPLRALHVDHGLHPGSARWRERAAAACDRLAVPFAAVAVDARPAAGQSPEAAAREARYVALGERLAPGEWLLTAHHLDDQAETVLLQLLRGAGIEGLAGMPARARFAPGWLVRPWLDQPRAALAAYAASHRLDWCEDPDNASTARDRNFLRHEILPRLAARWPAATECLARSAGHCAEASFLLEALAAVDLGELGVVPGAATLPLDGVRRLDPARRRLLLRRWLAGLGLPRPAQRVLARIEREVLGAGRDRNPHVAWPGGEVRRYRDRLYAGRPPDARPDREARRWDVATPLVLPWGRLWGETTVGDGLDLARLENAAVTVTTRAGGERLRLQGRHRRPLKKLLQEAGVPPWRRERLPLVLVDGELAAVADLWVTSGFAARPGRPGLRLRWQEGMANGCD
ncbi:MAG: tRNA lysidine(34) synthetase TilS [Gammaproteobacteria bacterium]|nr:tRNA lysidine(34) synthetase TilS [Gammaproteobacteria bacterium]